MKRKDLDSYKETNNTRNCVVQVKGFARHESVTVCLPESRRKSQKK